MAKVRILREENYESYGVSGSAPAAARGRAVSSDPVAR